MKKTAFFGLLACMLILGFAVTGCDTTTGGETDTWSDITSLAQIDGRWKGSLSQTVTFKEVMEAVIGEIGEELPPEAEAMLAVFENIILTTSLDMDVTINASAESLTGSIETTQAYSGENINLAWQMITAMLTELPEGVNIDNQNHSISMTQDMGTNQIDVSDMAGVQINQNGTKVKFPLESMMGQEIQGLDLSELILIKQ